MPITVNGVTYARVHGNTGFNQLMDFQQIKSATELYLGIAALVGALLIEVLLTVLGFLFK